MIASAPGKGLLPPGVWHRTILLQTVGAAATGALIGVGLATTPVAVPASWIAPAATIAIVPMVIGTGRPAGSLWRVPRRPTFFGRREGVGLVFGAALASGFLTELASYTLPVIALWCLSTRNAVCAAFALGLFGVVRTIPTIMAAIKSSRSDYMPLVDVPLASIAKHVRLVEVGLLTALAGLAWL